MKKTTINRILKITTILVIAMMLVSTVSAVFATGAAGVLGQLKGNTGAATAVTKTANNIIGIVQVICYAAAVIMLIYLGIKFITASPEGKAEIKYAKFNVENSVKQQNMYKELAKEIEEKTKNIKVINFNSNRELSEIFKEIDKIIDNKEHK